MAAKRRRRRRHGKAKQRRRRRKGQQGRGKLKSKLKNMALKAASEVISGLSKGKKGKPKVTTGAKIQLGIDLTTAAAQGPLSFFGSLLRNGQKIGTLLVTNYKNPGTQKGYEKVEHKSYRHFRRGC